MNGLKSEDQFLELIDQCFPKSHEHILLGRGDDAAVLACPDRITLTTDLFLEDEHFRRSYFEPEDVGHKALAANLSDIAAMGARPLGFCLGLMAPVNVQTDYWRRLFKGMSALAQQHDCPLVGGDLSRSDTIGLSIAAWGEASAERFLTRRGVEPGDTIFAVLPVHGCLGLARTGMLALEKALASGNPAEIEKTRRQYPTATAAHLRPVPLLAAGERLARTPEVKTCMDLSDGLARDLPRMLAQGLNSPLGAALKIDATALHPEVLAIAGELNLDPLEAAVLGGEDYGLLAAASSISPLADLPGLLVLGQVTTGDGITVNGRAWKSRGFDHFGG